MRTSMMVLVVIAFVAFVSGARAEEEERTTQQAVSVRIWYAEWDHPGELETMSSVDFGSQPLWFGYYDFTYGPWTYGLMAGYGSGWAEDQVLDGAERMDVQAYAVRAFGRIYAGAAYHYLYTDIDMAFDNRSRFTCHGPELVAGARIHLFESSFSLAAAATYMPLVMMDYKTTAFGDSWSLDLDDSTGYSFDVGLTYERASWHVAAGYRLMTIDDTEYDQQIWVNQTARLKFKGDQFQGPYVEAGYTW